MYLTGSGQGVYILVFPGYDTFNKSKKDGKIQETMQSSTTPDPRIPHGKVTRKQ